ncbi:unnamed protein product [Euphydryas editha]|uniref:Zinc finger PHD-type domain-containing protein n=1 Tax=Euphydryas editha TaxID=104508 RepID=A0AAU9UWN2_EUPED|nr:unnamed protein product [Euphydryas editha]CAH2104074.1 unnamed protein product [Euphydryas editha]
MKFACCKSTTGGATDSLTCTKCKLNYHIQCLQASGIKKDGKLEIRKHWICPECTLTVPRRGNNDNTPVRGVSNLSRSEEDISVDNNNVTLRRGGSSSMNMMLDFTCGTEHGESSIIELIRSVVSSEISILKDDFKKSMIPLQEELKSIREEFLGMKECFEFINSNFDNFNKRIENCEKDVQKLNKQFSELGEIRSSIATLKEENNVREQWARRSNVEIYGIPERKNENLLSILQNISEKTKCKLNPNTDIDFVTRVASKNKDVKKPKPIIVKFLCRWKKDDFLSQIRKLNLKCNDLGFSGNSNSVYFNDHLTSFNKGLLQSVKKIAKEKKYQFVWIKNCSIMVRRSSTSAVLHIGRESDLKKIV